MKFNSKGFTMIELSIVIIIMGLLFVGSFEANKHFMIQHNIKATIIKLNAIQNALDIYVIENGKLPCPAGLKSSNGESVSTCSATNSTSGIYVSSGSGIVSGAVPYEELNLTPDISHDSWNGKIIYSVSIAATSNIRKMNNSAYSGIKIYYDSTSNLITDRALYSLASNGKNKFGAFDFKKNSKLSTTGIGTYEAKNVGDSYTNENVYFSDYKTNDDIVRYKTRMQIINDTKLEDVNCLVNSTVISKLLTSNNISDSPSFSIPSGNYLGYNEEIESTSKKYKVKCFKYGRLGIFKYAD